MLTRLMFSGGSAQVLVMQAGTNGASYPSYGYDGYGSISPDYILHQGEKYVINIFYTTTIFGKSYLYFKNNKIPNGEKMIIEVNGIIYTLNKEAQYNRYRIDANLFTSVGTYIIKILSIE